MGAAPSRSPAASTASDARPRLPRTPTALRLTSRTTGVTDERAPRGARARLPPGGAETDPADWPFIEVRGRREDGVVLGSRDRRPATNHPLLLPLPSLASPASL